SQVEVGEAQLLRRLAPEEGVGPLVLDVVVPPLRGEVLGRAGGAGDDREPDHEGVPPRSPVRSYGRVPAGPQADRGKYGGESRASPARAGRAVRGSAALRSLRDGCAPLPSLTREGVCDPIAVKALAPLACGPGCAAGQKLR